MGKTPPIKVKKNQRIMSVTIRKEPIASCCPAKRRARCYCAEDSPRFTGHFSAIDRNSDYFGTRFPDAACENGRYPIIDNQEWTTSLDWRAVAGVGMDA